MSLEAETVHQLQDGETIQSDHEEVCWIGSRSKRKDGTDATPISREQAN